MDNSSIGDRMKRYEDATRYILPPRTYTIIRVDGKNFSAFTRDCDKPFDYDLMDAMEGTARYIFENMSGAILTYQQSDEISIVLQDFKSHNTEPWMGGVVQKQASIAASMATAVFNPVWSAIGDPWATRTMTQAMFDARTYTISDPYEVKNYLIWRQQDATRNAINMAASAVFSHKSLHKLTSNERQEKLFSEANINFNDYPTRAKRGSCIVREAFFGPITYTDKRTGKEITIPDRMQSRTKTDQEIPIFTSEEAIDYLHQRIGIDDDQT